MMWWWQNALRTLHSNYLRPVAIRSFSAVFDSCELQEQRMICLEHTRNLHRILDWKYDADATEQRKKKPSCMIIRFE